MNMPETMATGEANAPLPSPAGQAWQRFGRNGMAVFGAGVLLVLAGLLIFWPLITPHSPIALSDDSSQPPSWTHWFGTDVHGRDLLARVFFGARVSLLVGVVGAVVSLGIGVVWGSIAGYAGGKVDEFMMRCVDVIYSLPSIVFVIVLITLLETTLKERLSKVLPWELGPGTRLVLLFAGLGAVSWLTMARIVRGQVLALRNRSFVQASRVLGASHAWILRKHILPNISGVIIVYVTLTVPSIILYESFLSYLGLGIQPPQASLGSLIAEGAAQINSFRVYWWMIVFPSAILTLTLLALNFAGDGLRDAFEPRSARRSG